MMDNQLSYRRLQAYQVAKEAAAICVANQRLFVGLAGEVHSQLHRAMNSVLLNIIEGTGRWSKADQQRFYKIACGSATEVMGCLEIAELHGVEQRVLDEIGGRIIRVVQMLMALIRR